MWVRSVNLSIAELFDIFIAAALRRRRLIIVPILIFGALSILAIVVWPRQYQADVLLMLQEGQSSDPLGTSGGQSRQGRLKAEEIDTLLKSNRVLAGAINDMNLGKKPLSQKDIEGEIRSLRKQIGVSVVGSDFIQVEFKQSERDGIGERLSIIMTHFFEHLLTREYSMKTAREFALEQRRRDVVSTDAAIENWMTSVKAAGVAAEATDATPDNKIAELQKRYSDIEQKLLTEASTVLPGANLASMDQVINDEMRVASARSASSQLEVSSDRIAALKDLSAEVDSYRALGMELAQLRIGTARTLALTLLQSQASAANDKTKALYGGFYNEWEGLAARYAEAVEQYDNHVKRAKKASGPGMTPFGLVAPESIRIIDEPHDPELPTTSLLKILVACLGAGVGLGAGLAALAEQFDDRIYDSRGLGELTGVDAVFKIPLIESELDRDKDSDSGGTGERPPRRNRLSIVSGL
jgi:uncharacterized protein involved in exopolysaccharide biosynthesis